jgi:TRAP-type uncharacterized transport system substrate-binding protein
MFIEPAPPKHVVMSSGGQSGAYFAFGKRYAEILKRNGITLEVRTSAGSIENVKRLVDPNSQVSVALLQGGITSSKETPGIVSLGRVFIEPLWIFYRGPESRDRLGHLKGSRIAIGPEGSGTRHLARALLEPHGVTGDTATLLPLSGQDAANALKSGDADVVFLALAPQAAIVQALLKDPDVRLMNLAQADAMTRIFPYLQKITLPQGSIDLARNIPAADTTLVAPVAALAVRDTLHPALVGLLIDAAREVHGGSGLFNGAGDFPKPVDPELEMAADADRYFKAGPSWLRRTLPFWLSSFLERAIVIAVPLAGAMLPMIKLGPAIYRWRIRRRLLYWYGRLKALESTIGEQVSAEALDGQREEIMTIDTAVSSIPIPLAFSDQYYSLRAAIDLVRQRIFNRAVSAHAAMG